MMWKLREAAARALRQLAERLYEDATYRCFQGYFNITPGGIKVTQTDSIHAHVPGAPLYYREDEYDQAHQAPPPPPVGTVAEWPIGKPAPDGWLNLNGAYFNPKQYPELAAIIGTSPHLPDLGPPTLRYPYNHIIYAGKP